MRKTIFLEGVAEILKKYIMLWSMLFMVLICVRYSNAQGTQGEVQFSDKATVAKWVKVSIDKDITKYVPDILGVIVKRVDLIKTSPTTYTGSVTYSADNSWSSTDSSPHSYQEAQAVINIIGDGEDMQFTVLPPGDFTDAEDTLDPNLPPATNIMDIKSQFIPIINNDIATYFPTTIQTAVDIISGSVSVKDIFLTRRGDGEYTGCVIYNAKMLSALDHVTPVATGYAEFIHIYQDNGTQFKLLSKSITQLDIDN